jgi:hypothetical protein
MDEEKIAIDEIDQMRKFDNMDENECFYHRWMYVDMLSILDILPFSSKGYKSHSFPTK